jgi:outer membrane protein assembly factor BamD (BamD/ComL family)
MKHLLIIFVMFAAIAIATGCSGTKEKDTVPDMSSADWLRDLEAPKSK